MKYSLFALPLATLSLFVASCNSDNTAKQETKAADTVAAESVHKSVRLDNNLIGNFAEGNYVIYKDTTELSHTCQGTIKSVHPVGDNFATILGGAKPIQSRGKRVRFTGYVKSTDVKGWAGMWMRVDGPNDNGGPLSFDNMHERPIKGTTAWKKYEVVLDVPEEAININYGVLLAGDGQVWVDSLNVSIVDKSVPVTGTDPASRQSL